MSSLISLISPPVQVGIDVATSLAILASAATFLWNQKRKNDRLKIQQLDTSVRDVATGNIQKMLQTLSRQFISEIVTTLNWPSIILKGSLADVEQRFTRRENLASKLLDRLSEANDQLSSFSNEAEAYKYQIYPLLDTLRNGKGEVTAFKKQLTELIDKFNEINRNGLPLAQELERMLAFCADHPFGDLTEEQTQKLLEMSHSLMLDEDYKDWVNTFIPDDGRAIYWGTVQNEQRDQVRMRTLQNFIAYAYEKPDRLRAQVFSLAYMRYQEGRTMCKKFLIMLSALNHALLLGEDSNISLSDIVERYEAEEYFDLNSTIR